MLLERLLFYRNCEIRRDVISWYLFANRFVLPPNFSKGVILFERCDRRACTVSTVRLLLQKKYSYLEG